jgi:hypothetical protein
MITGSRMLISIRRTVPQDRVEVYAEAWTTLHRAATALGAHAWHFISTSQPDVFLEFLEFGADADIRADPHVVAAIEALHTQFGDPYPPPKTLEEWMEIPAPAREEA